MQQHKDETRYLTCAETAKLVRQALKEAFPGVAFSVTSKTYSGGASINVHWTDGPTSKDVEAIAKAYEGADFDGMIDLKIHNYHWLLPDGRVIMAKSYGTKDSGGHIAPVEKPQPTGAVRVSFRADYVFCNRHNSLTAITAAAARVAPKYGKPVPRVYQDQHGHVCLEDDGKPVFAYGPDTLMDLVWRDARETSLYQAPATAAKPVEEPENVTMFAPESPATSRQLWALHCLTKRDTRNWTLTKAEASVLIGKAKANEDISALLPNN